MRNSFVSHTRIPKHAASHARNPNHTQPSLSARASRTPAAGCPPSAAQSPGNNAPTRTPSGSHFPPLASTDPAKEMEKLGMSEEEEEMEVKEEEEEEEETASYLNSSTSEGGRRSRGREEKERTKMRERQRRAITARILGGLRKHGNYNLRVRADINEVIAALAREAGWLVLPDGTTFPSSQAGRPTTSASTLPMPHSAAPPLRGMSPPGSFRSLDHRQAMVDKRLRGVFPPPASPLCFATAGISGTSQDQSPVLEDSIESGEDGKVTRGGLPRLPDRDFSGTPYVPVYVMLPLGAVNMNCEVADPDGLINDLKLLKSAGVDGVMVDCWWGIVEANKPLEYNWSGYKSLFQIIKQLKLKLQVVMSFHKCGSNVGDDITIPLPNWVAQIGRANPDIYFTDGHGRRNTECLTWGIDKERVLRGRTALEVYFDFMRSFRVEFNELFEDGVISEIEVGLGPCGELRYPSYAMEHGWRYPGIGEFQCYDQYLMKSLRNAAEGRGHSFWGKGPDNAGTYNSRPQDTKFFCDGGDYDGHYGRFFLAWYSKVLIDHADHVLTLVKLAFEGSSIAVKLSGVHWWYKTASHAAELTAGFYNPCNRDGYAPITAMLKKHNAALNFTCVELRTLNQYEMFPEAMSDPEGLVWQVLNAAWDANIPVSSENALPCFDRDGFHKILENAKPFDDPDGRHLLSFTYLRLAPALFEEMNFFEFKRFVKKMHGEAVLDN
ncbi:Beta-amylase [Rhynchospora pubera]|uniref:Beta-amylase n=1 Tax=Rhynchospora pubera TaxID=906938 RepID=A0AAV8E2L1_9POAL|nr:Beta-amylase [Rhynchospora pubera]